MFALLLACAADPPGVDVVDPSGGNAGDTVKIVGGGFQDGATATLGEQPMTVTFRGLTLLEGTVPEGLAPGEHGLVVTNPDGQDVQVPRAFAISAPPEELVICDDSITAYSQLAAGRELIKIDRHKTGAPEGTEPERLEIKFSEIEAVEYEARVIGDDYCSAIVLRLKSGRRLVYEDSKQMIFKKKAQELAQIAAVPIDVTHEDPDVAPEE